MASEGNHWQLQCRRLRQRSAYLWRSGQWSDCSFLVGPEGHAVSAHRVFLAMASPVFEGLVYGKPEKKGPIRILDVAVQPFLAMLEYIYTDYLKTISFDVAYELYHAARRYMLPHLVVLCTRSLMFDLDVNNVCRAYELAKLFDEHALMDKCLQIFSTKTKEVLAASSFQEAELSTVVTVFSLDHLNTDSELDLFDALVRYADAERNMKIRSDVRSAIEQIRFLALTPKQFFEGPGRSPLLAESEKSDLVINIASSDTAVAVPNGFSSCREPRKRLIGRRPSIDNSNNVKTLLDSSDQSFDWLDQYFHSRYSRRRFYAQLKSLKYFVCPCYPDQKTKVSLEHLFCYCSRFCETRAAFQKVCSVFDVHPFSNRVFLCHETTNHFNIVLDVIFAALTFDFLRYYIEEWDPMDELSRRAYAEIAGLELDVYRHGRKQDLYNWRRITIYSVA